MEEYMKYFRWFLHFITVGVGISLLWNTVTPMQWHWFDYSTLQWICTFVVAVLLWLTAIRTKNN